MRRAAADPDATAVIEERRKVGYRELAERAHRIARVLRCRGVDRGARVGLQLPRSADAYAALLGILETGAAYVPIDPECPPERAAYMLRDCGARALVTRADLARARPDVWLSRVCLDLDARELESEDPAPPPGTGVRSDDLAYIIYTSGTTGRPKGVMIEHRSACHLVRTEGRLFGVRRSDRVYQGFPLAFDASVEEIWLAFCAGAALVPAAPRPMGPGDLADRLTADGITVLSCVPTFLGLLGHEVPSVRLLILGGEVCPQSLVTQWTRPGRRMVNTYGPTEATVIATCAELAPGRPVSIGRAIPGYRVHLLDEYLHPVGAGEVGQIAIGGPGVARGYVGLPELTGERFVPDPFGSPGTFDGRLYLTGDLARRTGDELEFRGRADTQVKLRGFRIELAEIESELMRLPEVRAAACVVREDVPGLPRLVGFAVPADGTPLDPVALRTALRRRLPEYMIPSRIEPLSELPRLPSGKLDRAALPRPQESPEESLVSGRTPTETERAIAEVWRPLFHPATFSLDDDFFIDLGGHSMLAARAVSGLRRRPRFAALSVLDLYEHPTITSLAAAVDDTPPDDPGDTARRPAGERTATRRNARIASRRAARATPHRLAALAQGLSLYAVFGIDALQQITPFLIFFLLRDHGVPLLAAAAWGLASAVAVPPFLLAVAVAAKWLLLGRIRPGRHPLWGGYYVRWWLAQGLIRSVPLDDLAGTPLLPAVFRLLGARIGRDVHLMTRKLAAFDLITIGDRSCIDEESALLGYRVEGSELVIGGVSVGQDGFVGTRAVMGEDTVLEDDARLEDLSLLPAGSRVPAGETWAGAPARPVSRPVVTPLPPPPPRSRPRRVALAVIYAALVLLLPILPVIAMLPGVALLVAIDPLRRPWLYVAATPLVGASFVVLVALEVVVLKWLLVGRVRPGSYPVHGPFYVRNWIVDQLLAYSLDVIAPLHATLWLAPWYRALGARLGRNVELSTATSTTPDLLEIADGGTVADECSLGTSRVERGWLTVAPTRLGRRAFVGNSAVVPAGTTLGDDALVGVLSLAPAGSDAAAKPGLSWLGSPPLRLPHREPSTDFVEARTYDPPRGLRLARRWFEILRVTLPPAGFILVAAATIVIELRLWTLFGPVALAVLPLVYAGGCAVVLLAVALAKWTLIGRYRPFVRPLWSPFVWRLELVNGLYEFLATPIALKALLGTPFLPIYLRMLGARIGRQVYVDTTGFLEWDLVQVGDRAALNNDSVLQTHLFEDRMLKSERLRVGRDATIGALSVVLYDSNVEDGARLGALSLVMKGETLPHDTAWAGIPARREDAPCGVVARIPRSERDGRPGATAA
jgi:non-ribosomal peptide synthetase-like protein